MAKPKNATDPFPELSPSAVTPHAEDAEARHARHAASQQSSDVDTLRARIAELEGQLANRSVSQPAPKTETVDSADLLEFDCEILDPKGTPIAQTRVTGVRARDEANAESAYRRATGMIKTENTLAIRLVHALAS